MGVVDVAAKDCFDRPDGPAGNGRRSFVHAGKRRIVAGPYPRLGWSVGIGREAAHRGDVVGRVQPLELIVGRRLGSQTRLGTDRAQ